MKIIEQNFDAKRKSDTYKPLSLSMYSNHFPAYPNVPSIGSGYTTQMNIIQRNRFIHKLFHEIRIAHRDYLMEIRVKKMESIPLDSPKHEELAYWPTNMFELKAKAESFIYHIKKNLDLLVQLSELLADSEKIIKNKKIRNRSLGDAMYDNTVVGKIVIGDDEDYIKSNTDFMETINDLFNSYKHSFLDDEVTKLIGEDSPTLTTLYLKYGNYNSDIFYHNHNIFHIMMGYQDELTRILANHKTYVNNR